MKMKANNMFRDQVSSVTSWFESWSTCEQTVVLYSLLKGIPPRHCRFLVQMLQQRISDDKEVETQEVEANDPTYICNLRQEPKEKVIQELLIHLPLLHSGNTNAKNEYLNLIPKILSHSIENSVFIEESRQLLSYSLIHPAITSEERSKFNMWLGHLEERFSNNQYHSPQQTQCQPDDLQGQGQAPFSHQPECLNSLRTHVTLSKQNSVGSAQLNGWNNAMFQSSESLNMNGIDSQGHSGSHGNLYGRGHSGQQIQTVNSTSSGHTPLQATLSAPPNFNTVVPPATSHTSVSQPNPQPQPATRHAPLRRMPSMAPPNSLPITTSTVSDWLQSNGAHLGQGPGRPGSVLSDHAPLSPQSSTASSGSGSDEHRGGDDNSQSVRNTFMEEGSGMRDVPLWLKSLRLHKYACLFQRMTFDEMMNINEDWLEHQNVTKGARNKIVLSIRKLQERQDVLRNLERDIMESGPIKPCISEMKAMLNTPIKAFNKPGSDPAGPLNSPGSGGDADNTIMEGDITAQFTRLVTKVFTQLMLTSPYDDEGLNMCLQLIDKCINHEAFSDRQKRLLDSFKQKAREIWQPAPVKYTYDKKPRANWGNTFPGGNLFNSRPIQRMGVKPMSKPPLQGGMQWSFGAKRSLVGGTSNSGHLQLQRNNSHNTAMFSRPGLIEQPVKQPVTRTQSAPQRGHGLLLYNRLEASEPQATDIEINARLDSLCRSVTECALAGSDGNERGSTY